MDKKEAYQIVLDDLMQCDLFRGKYDAKHGASEHYMYGICTVMEAIAYRVSEKTGDAFSDMFLLTMIKSEEKTETHDLHTETHDLRTETHGVCLDTISRAEAINACINDDGGFGYGDDIIIRLEGLPSAIEKGCDSCRFDKRYGEESICSSCARHYSDCYAPQEEGGEDD